MEACGATEECYIPEPNYATRLQILATQMRSLNPTDNERLQIKAKQYLFHQRLVEVQCYKDVNKKGRLYACDSGLQIHGNEFVAAI